MTQMLKVISGGECDAVEELSDDDLMYLAAHNRRDAFEALVTRHQSLVFGLATRFLADRQLGRDVAQDVFLTLWADRHKYRRKGLFRRYLTSICINRCRVVVRGMRNQDKKTLGLKQETDTRLDAENEVPLDALLKTELRKEIQRYLTRLPEKTRAVIIYRFTHEMALAEIAELTGMPLGTVKSHVNRGLVRIRRMMKRGK